MLIASASTIGGLVLLFFGGEALVRGAVSLAARFRVPQFVIGLTIVGFGTSMPELTVSADAALRGSPDIAVGNVVGSNIANILLILGLSALIAPIAAYPVALRRDLAAMVGAAVALLALAQTGEVPRLVGLLLVSLLIGYLVATFSTGRASGTASDIALEPVTRMTGWGEGLTIAGGLVALVAGADLLVNGATIMARTFGISEAVIGLTIVAVGTSLPEMATSLVAAFRRQAGVALGNVMGSNIFNILGILGLTAVITPLSVAPTMAGFDIPLMLAVSLGLVACIFALHQLTRPVGAAFLGGYAVYVWWLF